MGKISNGESTGRPLQADFDCPRLPTILLSITARLWQARHLLDWSERAFGWVRLKKGFRAFQFNRCPYLGSRSIGRRVESVGRISGLRKTDSGRVSMPWRGYGPPRSRP